MSGRYAVFFCPDDRTELAEFGQRVLGRDADGSLVAPSTDDYPDRSIATMLSETPAHYGFHATLKAPFQLNETVTESDLLIAVDELAKQHAPIAMVGLRPRCISDFVALCFDIQPMEVATLATRCVLELEAFRAPLAAEDIAKRKPDQLTDAQRENLYKYGYPYVLEEFRFHMTLTGVMDRLRYQTYIDWLNRRYDSIVRTPQVLDNLSVFWQPDRQTVFRRIAQFAFIDVINSPG